MDFDEGYDDTNSTVDLAAKQGNIVLMKELLQQGFPTNGYNNRGWRPLHEAANGGHVECVRLLLEADDAEVDALNHDGKTALYLALEPGECYTEIVKLLLHAGANPSGLETSDYCFPLPKAVFNNLYDIVKLLLDAGGNTNFVDFMLRQPLRTALKEGHLKIAQLLIDSGTKVLPEHLHNLFWPLGEVKDDSALIPCIDLLVKSGLDINVRGPSGSTPLIMAVEYKKIGVISHLLELGADPNIKDNSGNVAFHYVIKFWQDSSTERHDGSNSEGETTAHVIRKILDLTSRQRIIPAKLQKIHCSIFHLAIKREIFNTLKLMVNAGLPPDAFLEEMACPDSYEADVKWLPKKDIRQYCQEMFIDLGIEVNTPLGFLLLEPLNKERVEMAKFMIDKGSNVNAVVPRCLPPLVAAVKHQRTCYNPGCPGLDILEHLLNNGVDVMHKISATDILPAALHISSLFNVRAFFTLLVRCIPVHEIYTPWALESLSQLYSESVYYMVHPLMPWRVISWLNVINMFIPQLPLNCQNLFDIHRMAKDDDLSRAWDDLNAQIGSPKTLKQLCILTVRRVVGERRGWNKITIFLRKLTLINEPLPDLIMDLLMFKQMESSCLSKGPSYEVLFRYFLSAVDGIPYNRNANPGMKAYVTKCMMRLLKDNN